MFNSLRRLNPRGAPPAPAAAAAQRPVDPEALLRRMEWTVIRRLDGLLHGDYRTLLRGFGLDLADPDQADQWVAAWGRFLADLGYQPLVQHITYESNESNATTLG